jgi:nuclear transport factor 2 (NTF2) superfamily protein
MLSGQNSLTKGGWNIEDFNRVALAVTRFSHWGGRGSMGSRATLQELIDIRKSRIDIKQRAIGHIMQ